MDLSLKPFRRGLQSAGSKTNEDQMALNPFRRGLSGQEKSDFHKPIDSFPSIPSVSRMFGGGSFQHMNPDINSYSMYKNCLPAVIQELQSRNETLHCLDLGCGYGLSTLSLLSSLHENQSKKDNSFTITGCDINSSSIAYAQGLCYAKDALENNFNSPSQLMHENKKITTKPELHSQIKDPTLKEKFRQERELLMVNIWNLLDVSPENNNQYNLSSQIKESEKPSFINTNLKATNLQDEHYQLLQSFGIFPSCNEQNSSKLLKTIANKLSPGGILFSDFPLVNDLQDYNQDNVLNSGLRVKNIPIHGINYQVLEKPLRS